MNAANASFPQSHAHRWLQAVLALITMVMISPYEYTFTVFERPIANAHHWALPSVALTFTIYVIVASLFMIPSGYWSDRWQPRWFATIAGIVAGLGWVGSAYAATPWELYLAYGLGSLGPGYIYANNINDALKWFPEANKRGVAVGMIDLGFGLGSAIFIPLLSGIIKHSAGGYHTAFWETGVAMLVVIVIVAQFQRFPEKNWSPADYDPKREEEAESQRKSRVHHASHAFTVTEVLRTWQYWVALLSLTLITAAGLMVAAHIVDMGVVAVGVGAVAAVAAATYSRISNGVMRWAAGDLSDYIGRELSMLIWFVICGIAIIAMAHAHSAGLFIALTVIALGGWGPLFSLFPALVGDYWGRGHSGLNYGVLYGPGKAIGGIFGGVIAASLYASSHSWTSDFHLAGGFAIAAGILAILLHPPSAARRAGQEPRDGEQRAA
jgi:MFS transporter, OFA family, oxalate/formate antiporter